MLFLTVFSLYLVGASAFILPPTRVSIASGRIVGGVETTIEDRPFSASLQFQSGSHTCGASILSSKYLLSAAHCRPSTRLYARVGSTDYLIGGQLYEVIQFTNHPLYSRPTLDYDMAVLTVDKDIVFGPSVTSVVLPNNIADPGESEVVVVSGWGVTSESSPSVSRVLRKVDLPAWSNERCRNVYSFITARQICLGGTPQGGTSACFGDSGGPVTFNGIQVALVSGGQSCSAPNIPGIYARLSSVLDWIKEQADLD